MPHESEASIGALLRTALDDIRDLFREEVALARAELRQDLNHAGSAAARFGGAAAAVAVAAVFLLTALALGLADLLNWPAWAGFACVGVLLAVAGGVLISSARRAVREIRGL